MKIYSSEISGSLKVRGDIFAENYVVKSTVSTITQSFSSGSTVFGDTPADDTHQFTGSLSVSGSSVKGYSGASPTAILSNPATGSAYGLHVRGFNKGIRIDRHNSTNASAHTSIIHHSNDYTYITQNTADPVADFDNQTSYGVAVNKLGGAFYPENNNIAFSGYDKAFTRLGITQLTMNNDITFSLPYNKNFIVSGSEIEFTPTEKVEITGNIEVSGEYSGNISGSSTSTGSFGAGYIDNKLGIGTTSPEEEIHIVGSNATVMVAESGGTEGKIMAQGPGSGLSLYTTTSSPVNIATNVGGPSADYTIRANTDKTVVFQNSTTGYDRITFSAASSSISSSQGFIYFEDGQNISGSSTSTGSFGHLKLAGASSGNVTGHLVPSADGVYDLGTTNSQDWRKIYAREIDLANSQFIAEVGSSAVLLADHAAIGNGFRFTHRNTKLFEVGDSSNRPVISGSATSTGSFGHGHFASQLGVGTTSPSSNLIHGTGDKPTTLRLDNTSSALNYILLKNSTSANNYIQTNAQSIQLNADANGSGGIVDLMTNNTLRLRVDSSGHTTPGTDDTYNLGSSSKRWADVFAVQTTTGGVFETGLKTEKIGDNPTGTIVSWRGDGLVPCDSNEDELVMGVIKEEKDEPIVMGAEPVLVTGKVDVGDYIVTSDKIGHGKSVKRGYLLKKDLFGKVIAQALEPSDDSDSCLIKCMIRKM